MRTLTSEETHAFLLTGTHTAKLATMRVDGRPHVAPIWFDMDGDTLVFTTWHSTIKAMNMRRDPRVSLCVDDEIPPFGYVLIDGIAQFSDDMETLRYWATRIAARYMGGDKAEAYGQRNAVPGELVVRVTPVKIIAQTGIAD